MEWRNAVDAAQAGDSLPLVEIVRRLEARQQGRGWLRLWKESHRLENAVMPRTLAFLTMERELDSPVAECVQAWLVVDDVGADVSTDLNILGGVQSFLIRHEKIPPALGTWLYPFLRRKLAGEVAVRHAAFDLINLGLDYEVGSEFLNTSAARELALLLEAALEDTVEDEEIEALTETAAQLRTRDFGTMPVVANDCRRIAGALHGIVANAAVEDRATATRLLGYFRRLVTVEEATEQAVLTSQPLYTLRTPKSASIGLLDKVTKFIRSLLLQSVTGEGDETTFPVTLLAPSMASFGLHWAFVGVDGLVQASVLDSLFRASTENELATLAESFDSKTLLTFHALLDEVRTGVKSLEITITDPDSGIEWRRTLELTLPARPSEVIKTFGRLASRQRRKAVLVRAGEIPQANSLEKVLMLVDAMLATNQVTSKDIEVSSQRQVAYYKHAARVLGLLDERNELSSRGLAMHRMKKDQRMRALANYFVDTPVCRAWAAWGDAGDVFELVAESAREFLGEAESGLGGATPGRRASTLETWHGDLHGYYRQVPLPLDG